MPPALPGPATRPPCSRVQHPRAHGRGPQPPVGRERRARCGAPAALPSGAAAPSPAAAGTATQQGEEQQRSEWGIISSGNSPGDSGDAEDGGAATFREAHYDWRWGSSIRYYSAGSSGPILLLVHGCVPRAPSLGAPLARPHTVLRSPTSSPGQARTHALPGCYLPPTPGKRAALAWAATTLTATSAS